MAQKQIGPHKVKRQAGKGSFISSTFGSSWLEATEDRLAKRRYECTRCGVLKPEGKCKACGYEPVNGGW